MSRGSNTVTVSILDKEYQVACPEEQQADLLLSAKHLDEQMRSIRANGKVIGLERIAVMAALNISHELLQARNGVAPATQSRATSQKGKRVDEADASTPDDRSGDGSEPASNSAENADVNTDQVDERSLSGLNAKLDRALNNLRQLEIG